jgi:hypothetical protein
MPNRRGIRENLEMSTPSIKLKTILWAVAVAVFMSGPVYAIDEDLSDDEGTTKSYLNAPSCGKRNFARSVEPPAPRNEPPLQAVFIEPEGPFQGSWALDFTDNIAKTEFMGGTDLSGIYIEMKPDRRLTMGLDDADYIQLNDYVDGQLDTLCGGTLLDALVITRFDGTFSRASFDGSGNRRFDRLTIKFRSKFTWVDLDGKMRKGRFHFQSEFDSVRPVPVPEPEDD